MSFSELLWMVMVVIALGVPARLEAGEGPGRGAGLPGEVGWAVEFDDAADVEQLRPGAAGALEPDQISMKVEDGVLHLGAAFGAQTRHGDGVLLTPPASFDFDLTQFPVLEVRWRVAAGNDPVAGYWVFFNTRSPDGNEIRSHTAREEGLYGRPPDGTWRVTTTRLVPDSSFPGPATARQITSLFLAVVASKNGYDKPAGMEVDYIRIRRLTPEETQAEQVRVDRLARYEPPEIPEPWRDTFFYGVYSAQSCLKYMGGWEGVFDQLARCHFNSVLRCPGDLPRIARAAEPLGIYVVFPSPGGLVRKLDRSNDPKPIEEEVRAIVATVRDLPNVAGWFLGETAPEALWGVAGTKWIFEQEDPGRFVLFLHHNLAFLPRLDRFATVAWTYTYPVTKDARDPWAVADWCRSVSTVSNRPQWFTPQAFGEISAGPWVMPTVEEFRLMMNLALANGAKSFGLFEYAQPQLWGEMLVDWVGNPTPLMHEATRLGERWMSVVPVMLHARPILEPRPSVWRRPGPEHGLSVTAMGDAADGPVFLVVVNEDLAAHQKGKVRLPDAFAAGSRGVYDLYALDEVPMTDGKKFDVSMLDPGDARVYLLGTQEQFEDARSAILSNGVKEELRVQGADRVIAERWKLDLGEYETAVERTRALLDADDVDEACRASEDAASTLEGILASGGSLVACRKGLLAARENLGAMFPQVFLGSGAVPGREVLVAPLNELCEEYGQLRHRYLTGQRKDALLVDIDNLGDKVSSLSARIAARVSEL